jgi:hypothetical protein
MSSAKSGQIRQSISPRQWLLTFAEHSSIICIYQDTYGKEVSYLKGNKNVQYVWMQVGNEKEHQEGKEEQGKRQEEIITDFRLVRRSLSAKHWGLY